ncbi:MAG: hypothetical protein JO340_06525 [Acidobacteriaceae bacterium]|nr:hypothetical protein [Acidobacteriaceae bacterium]
MSRGNYGDGDVFAGYHSDHGDFDIVGQYPPCVALPFDCPPELKRRVLAAIISWKLCLSSVDYTLKRYVKKKIDAATQGLSPRRVIAEALQAATSYSNRIIDRIADIPDKPDDIGFVFATATLLRSKSTLRACGILLKLGHGAESFTVARALLEQIAWIYASHQSKTPEELESVTAPKAVRQLARLVPGVGRLYGYLSDVAHISPRHTRQYLDVSEDRIKVIAAGTEEDKVLCARLLLRLVDVQTIVAEHIYADYLPVVETICKNADGTFAIRDDRPFVADTKEYASRLNSFSPSQEGTAEFSDHASQAEH